MSNCCAWCAHPIEETSPTVGIRVKPGSCSIDRQRLIHLPYHVNYMATFQQFCDRNAEKLNHFRPLGVIES